MPQEFAFEEFEDPSERLWTLGKLKIEYFHDIIKAGEAERRTSTLNDVVNAPGTRDYFGRVRASREILIKEVGWQRVNLHGMPLVVNSDKTLGIGVTRGDARTGVKGRPHPRTLRPLGDMKQRLVAKNMHQEALFEVQSEAPVQEAILDDEELAALVTWFLVTRRVSIDGKVIVYSELSRPIRTDNLGHVIEWAERICLPPVEFEGVIDYIEGDDDGPEFEVFVEEH